MIDWRPFETAPKDGTLILVVHHFDGDLEEVWYNVTSEQWESKEGNFSRKFPVPMSHWAPINYPSRS